jgi:DNA-binding NarL/FixJ family response regulator
MIRVLLVDDHAVVRHGLEKLLMTEAEIEVVGMAADGCEALTLVTEGMANKQIARRLGISERTVTAHLTNIFPRIGVTDRTQAALWARDSLL